MTPQQRRALIAARKRRQAARQKAGNDPVLRTLRNIEKGTAGFDKRVEFLTRRIKMLERQNKARNISLPGSEGTHRVGGEKRKFSYARAVRYILTGREAGNELEVEVMKQAAKKVDKASTQIAGQDSLGGFLVPAQVTGELIDNVRAALVAEAAGCRFMPNLAGSPVTFAKKTKSTTGRWVGEIEPADQSNIELGELSMVPRTGAGMAKVSKRLIMLATEAADMMIQDDLTETIALLIDDAILHGNGSQFQPLGFANTPDILTVEMGSPDGGNPTPAKMREMVSKVREAKGLRTAVKPGWVIPPVLVAYFESVQDNDGRPLYKMGQTSLEDDGVPSKLHGYPWYDTDQVYSDLAKGGGTDLCEIFFADWDAIMVGQWGGLEIEVTDQTTDAFKNREVWIQAYQDIDVGVRQEIKLCYANDANPVYTAP